MKGIDSNVLLRYLMNDDPHQSEHARAFMSSLTTDHPGYINLIVLIETVWVLRHHYKIHRDIMLSTIAGLLNVPSLLFQHDEEIRQALRLCQHQGVDLPDALLTRINQSAGCHETVTFDLTATRLQHMSLLDL